MGMIAGRREGRQPRRRGKDGDELERLADDRIVDVAVEAAVVNGPIKPGERALDASGRPALDLARDGGLAGKRINRGCGRTDEGIRRLAGIEGGTGALEIIEMALRRAGDDKAGGAGRDQPAVAEVEGGGVAGGRGIDGFINGKSGGIADDGGDVGKGDRAGAMRRRGRACGFRPGSACGRRR